MARKAAESFKEKPFVHRTICTCGGSRGANADGDSSSSDSSSGSSESETSDVDGGPTRLVGTKNSVRKQGSDSSSSSEDSSSDAENEKDNVAAKQSNTAHSIRSIPVKSSSSSSKPGDDAAPAQNMSVFIKQGNTETNLRLGSFTGRQFTNLSAAVQLEIFKLLRPRALIRVSSVCKSIRKMLGLPSASHVWQISRKNEGAPDPPMHFTEFAWAFLLFGTCCQKCGERNKTVKIMLPLLRRVCMTCLNANLVPSPLPVNSFQVKVLDSILTVGLDALCTLGGSSGNAPAAVGQIGTVFVWLSDFVNIFHDTHVALFQNVHPSSTQRPPQDALIERCQGVKKNYPSWVKWLEKYQRVQSGLIKRFYDDLYETHVDFLEEEADFEEEDLLELDLNPFVKQIRNEEPLDNVVGRYKDTILLLAKQNRVARHSKERWERIERERLERLKELADSSDEGDSSEDDDHNGAQHNNASDEGDNDTSDSEDEDDDTDDESHPNGPPAKTQPPPPIKRFGCMVCRISKLFQRSGMRDHLKTKHKITSGVANVHYRTKAVEHGGRKEPRGKKQEKKLAKKKKAPKSKNTKALCEARFVCIICGTSRLFKPQGVRLHLKDFHSVTSPRKNKDYKRASSP